MKLLRFYSTYVLLLVLGSTVFTSCSKTHSSQPDKTVEVRDFSKMNILFINDEDLSFRAIGSYGNPAVITPNIDLLAAQGIKFNHAICQSPMCNPSRASFLTGLRPESTNIFTNQDLMNDDTPQEARGLAAILSQKNAFLANIGKLYHGREKHIRYDDFDMLGYCKFPDDYKGQRLAEYHQPCENRRFIYSEDAEIEAELKKRKIWYDSMNKIIPATAENWWFDVGIPYVGMQFQLIGDSGEPETCDEDYKKARAASEFLKEKAKSGEQFFLSVGFSKPHTPIRVPKEYMDMYDVNKISLPANRPENDRNMLPASKRFGNGADIFTGWFDDEFPQLRETEERQKKAIAAYYASATFIDEQLGHILETLDKTGLAENTIVVFMTDHGFHLGEHGLWSKYSVFDEVLRVPLIIKVPGVDPAEHDGIVELVDLLPTLCDLWGVEKPSYLDGKSLLPAILNPAKDIKTAGFNTFDQKGISGKEVKGYTVRTKRYRLTKWGQNGEHGVELYDFKNDSLEQINVAGLKEYQPVRDSLLNLVGNNIL